MLSDTRKYILYFIWLIIVLSGPITIANVTNFNELRSNPVYLLNVFQRITAILAFTILYTQIVLGAILARWLQYIGARAYKIHITQGLVAYGFALVHPLFENAIVYMTTSKIADTLLVFIPKFSTQRDLLLVYGRVALLFLTIAVIAGYFRTKPVFRRNWRYFHLLNYFVFYLIAFHARVGSDFFLMPFRLVYLFAVTTVTALVLYRILNFIQMRMVKNNSGNYKEGNI